ncbi:MAG: hypothetical protein M1294_00940 [Firmicutes bacterium]|nr:hypothetical protein [Bacillota bacterium]
MEEKAVGLLDFTDTDTVCIPLLSRPQIVSDNRFGSKVIQPLEWTSSGAALTRGSSQEGYPYFMIDRLSCLPK